MNWGNFTTLDPPLKPPISSRLFGQFYFKSLVKCPKCRLSWRAKNVRNLSNSTHFHPTLNPPQISTFSPARLRLAPPKWRSCSGLTARCNVSWDPPTASQRAPPGSVNVSLVWSSFLTPHSFNIHVAVATLPGTTGGQAPLDTTQGFALWSGDKPPPGLTATSCLATWLCFANWLRQLLRRQVGVDGVHPRFVPHLVFTPSMWRSLIPVVLDRIFRGFVPQPLPYPSNTPFIHSHAAGACGEATPPNRRFE